jgi:hypothetical protein
MSSGRLVLRKAESLGKQVQLPKPSLQNGPARRPIVTQVNTKARELVDDLLDGDYVRQVSS